MSDSIDVTNPDAVREWLGNNTMRHLYDRPEAMKHFHEDAVKFYALIKRQADEIERLQAELSKLHDPKCTIENPQCHNCGYIFASTCERRIELERKD